ncbi:hypothetical protein [Rhodanobacter hydrolyticus]|uniref:Phage tail protein n=1 Tax=Rhodanobacter hydrolyticus TaxID=2250595 RepID=A0ABW8J3V8_9GAMM
MLSSAPPTSVPLPFANSGTKNAIPTASQIGITAGAASLTDGFPPLTFTPISAGGVPPFGADFNGILNLLSQTVQWVQAGGQFGYNSTFQTAISGYPKGALLLRSDLSGFWLSTADGNTTDPDTGGSGWIPCGGSSQIASVALSGSAVTLTALQAASPIIILTGTLTANLNVVFPAWAGVEWTVINSTSGAFTVTCKTASGTGVAVAQSGAAFLYSDGTNILQPSAMQVGAATQPNQAVQFGQLTGLIGSMRNASMSVTSAGASATFAADQVVVGTALNGLEYLLPSYSQTINLATTGAGGMDTGSAPVSGFVALYAIYNPTTATTSILATNATSAAAPTIYAGGHMPSGYTASALIGVWPTNASSQFVIGYQNDRSLKFVGVTAVNTTTNASTPTSVSISAAIPKNALSISGNITVANNTANSSVSASINSDVNGSSKAQTLQYIVSASGAATCPFGGISIATPQAIFYTLNPNTGVGTLTLSITGYTF